MSTYGLSSKIHSFELVTRRYSGDPLLRSLTTSVVAASLHVQQLTVKNSTKKAVIVPATPADPLLEVVLHDTVIFPEGGGQPTDTGIITTAADGVIWEVVKAKRRGEQAVHYVRVPDGNVNNAVLAFRAGASVTVALEHDGFNRRYDHVSLRIS